MAKFELIKKFKGENDLLPKRKTVESAGYDFIVAEDTVILPYHYHFSNLSQSVFEEMASKKLEEKYKTGLDAVINYPSWSDLFCCVLLWTNVWNFDGF